MLPIVTDRSGIRSILLEWMRSQGSQGLLGTPIADLRPLDAFMQKRLCTAAHLPAEDLANHCYLLPDKDVAFGVVLPAHTDLPIQECSNLPEFLHSRKWSCVSWYIKDCQDLWDVAAELGVLEGDAFPRAALLQRFLFRPCPLLLQEIHRIESSLLLTCASPQETQDQAPAACQQQTQQHHAGQVITFNCLEPGCGSGRNMVWLATKQSNPRPYSGTAASDSTQGAADGNGCRDSGEHQPSASSTTAWTVLGIDNWYAALARVQELCQATLISPTAVKFWYCGIHNVTGLLEACSMPTTASKHAVSGADTNTHIAAVPDGTNLPTGHWHLILCVRFLERSFLSLIPDLLAPGGFLLFNTFLDMEGTRRFGRPKGDNHLLQRHELAGLFGQAQGFEVLRDDIELCRDGRELCLFVARKLPAT